MIYPQFPRNDVTHCSIVDHIVGMLGNIIFYFLSDLKDWDEQLATVVYCINTSRQCSTKHTPYFVSLG